MLKEALKEIINNQARIELFPEEYDFVVSNQLVDLGVEVIKKDANLRFYEAYMERSNKETEELLGEETADFLNESISYFKTHMNEFLYMESEWFALIGVDAISFEVDDVFGTYDVMLGLKIQKKFSQQLRQYFTDRLTGSEDTVDLMFDSQEGIWNINFSLHSIPGFHEDMSVGEAYQLVYSFLFHFIELKEKSNKLGGI